MKAKSQVHALLTVELALLDDAQAAYPTARDFVRDKDRITLLAKTRGLAAFTLDLPCLDALLLAGLETGRVEPHGPLSRAVSKTDLRPRLFRSLWSRVFDKRCCLLEDPDATAIAFIRQLCCLGKKIEVDCTRERVEEALSQYYRVESSLPRPTLPWDSDDLGDDDDIRSLSFAPRGADDCGQLDLLDQVIQDRSVSSSIMLDRLFEHVSSVLGEFNPLSETLEYRHGPGAVADLRGSGFKYQFPTWPVKLDNQFPFDWCGATHIDQEDRPSPHEPPSRLIAVPKTAKAPRFIAAEPVAHQWCQQAIFRWMDGRFRDTWIGDFIDLRDQGASQRLVTQASIDRELVTVDLSSASDRLSCYVVERAFKRNPSFLRALHASRTRWVRDEISSVPNYFVARKFAAMGSAVTFPVQSLVFLVLALHSCGWNGRFDDLKRLKGKVRVFGDDIILPEYGYAPLQTLLASLSLKINREKSFSRGHFRESCGQDSWRGYDVTPLKPKVCGGTKPAAVEGTIALSNNLHSKGFWQAARASLSTLDKRLTRLLILQRTVAGCALFTFGPGSIDHLDKRWNSDTQRTEVRTLVVKTKAPRRTQHVKESLLQFFTEAPDPMFKWSSGLGLRPRSSLRTGWVAPGY